MPHSFADNFWDADFNGTEGYDRLILRLKDGKKLYDSFAEFARNRAKVEEDYGRNLIKLAAIEYGSEELGSLKTSWDTVKKETENIGIIHIQLSKQLIELSERSIKFREQQKQERLKIDDFMRKEQKEKRNSYDSMTKAKRLYEQRCREFDVAKDAYDGKCSYTPKEEEKLKKNMQKCKTILEAADSAYLSAVKVLEELRRKYIGSMEDSCRRFQSIEEARIQFLRNEMWLYTNYGSSHAVDIDQKYEHCRNSLEKCHVKQDLEYFIQKKNTGSTRPCQIEYVNFYNPATSSDWSTNINTKNAMNNNPAISEKSSSHPNLHTNNSSREQSPLSTSKNPVNYLGQYMYSTSNPNLLDSSAEDGYASVSEIYAPKMNIKNPTRARVLFDYKAQTMPELTLNTGDVIEVVNIIDDMWGMGILDGRKGAFPLTFVELA